jgi:hypothetical protein
VLAKAVEPVPGAVAALKATTKAPAPSDPSALKWKFAGGPWIASAGPKPADPVRTDANSTTEVGSPGTGTVQSTAAAPVASTVSPATSPAPGPEMATGAPQVPDPGGRRATRTTGPPAVWATQAIVATPPGPMAIRGEDAVSPAGVRSAGASQRGAPTASEGARTSAARARSARTRRRVRVMRRSPRRSDGDAYHAAGGGC